MVSLEDTDVLKMELSLLGYYPLSIYPPAHIFFLLDHFAFFRE